MLDATTAHDSSLLKHWLDDRHEARLRVARRRKRAVRNWTATMLDKLVCGASIVLLAPAIFAVWIAIRRSAPKQARPRVGARPVIGRAARPIPAEPAVRLTINPALICMPKHAGTMEIVANRAISA